MVGIQDRLQNLHVAIADIFEPDGQEEGPPPLCMRCWLERSVCAAGTLNIFARSLSWNHSDCLLVQRSTVPSCAAESNSLVLSISWLPISGLVKEWLNVSHSSIPCWWFRCHRNMDRRAPQSRRMVIWHYHVHQPLQLLGKQLQVGGDLAKQQLCQTYDLSCGEENSSSGKIL